MKITIIQAQDGNPVVSVQGDPNDSPEDVAKAYLKTIEELKEEE